MLSLEVINSMTPLPPKKYKTNKSLFLVHDLNMFHIRVKIWYDPPPPLQFSVVNIHFITILGDHLVIRPQVATIL